MVLKLTEFQKHRIAERFLKDPEAQDAVYSWLHCRLMFGEDSPSLQELPKEFEKVMQRLVSDVQQGGAA